MKIIFYYEVALASILVNSQTIFEYAEWYHTGLKSGLSRWIATIHSLIRCVQTPKYTK